MFIPHSDYEMVNKFHLQILMSLQWHLFFDIILRVDYWLLLIQIEFAYKKYSKTYEV